MSDKGDYTIYGGHDHTTQACPDYRRTAPRENCGQMRHLTHECTHRSPPWDSHPLSEISQRTPQAPGDPIKQIQQQQLLEQQQQQFLQLNKWANGAAGPLQASALAPPPMTRKARRG